MRIVYKMKEMYFRAIMRQEQGWFDSNNAYEFSTKVQAQIKQVEGGVGEKLGTMVMMVAQLISGIIIAMTTSWKLTLVLLTTSPFIVFSIVLMTRAMKNGVMESRKAYEKAGGIAEEVLYNMKTVASFANFDFEKNRFSENIENCKEIGIKNGFKYGIGMAFVFFFIYVAYCIAIIYGSYMVINREWNSNAGRVFQGGDVLTCIMSTVMAVASIGLMSPNMKAIGEANVAASDFFQLQEREPKINVNNSTLKPEKNLISGKIEFKGVSFAYPSKPDVNILKNIDLLFEPGKKIAIVGESGSGKSTVVNLLERLYDCSEGEILIDGINVKNIDLNYLRSLIGYVQQEPVLFNKSIKENIIFGRNLSKEENVNKLIEEACEDAYANEFIKNIDAKYDYIVGIKGSKLSGGQKQRIAIARAILMKPKILLLDEATSALDNKSEKEVQKALDHISQKNVTTVIIAHRLSTIKNADKIYAMKNGIVVEWGTHDELLSKGGYYAGLVKSQMIDEEIKKKIETEEEFLKTEAENPNRHETELALKEPSKVRSESKNSNKPDQEIEDKENSGENNIKVKRMKLFSFIKDKKCDIVIAAIGSAINGCVFPLYGFIFATSINALTSPDMEIVREQGFLMGMMFLVISISAGIATFMQNYKFTEIGEVLTANLRNSVFTKYLSLHLSYFDKNENAPGALCTKLSIDTTLLNGIVLTVVGVVVQSLVCFIIGMIIGFIYDWRLSLICLAFFPFMIMSSYLQHKMRRGYTEGDDKMDIEAGSILSECVINTKTIFSYNFTEKAIEMYLEYLEAGKSTFTKQAFIQGFLFGIGQFSMFAAYATVFYAGGEFIMGRTLNFDDMTRAVMSILYAAIGVGNAQRYVGDYTKAKISFKSIFSTLELKTEIDTDVEANKQKLSAENIEGKIEFKNVSFAYPTRPETPVLKRLNFTIFPGQSVAFVGYSGSGKSTIVQLIERFYDVNKGQILIDDVDIRDYNLLELRKKIGLVSQEPVLFKRSVKENILYGKLSASDSEIHESAHNANITKFFTSKDDGTKDTPVSGGEKQRLATARAFLKNPKILLLDEATSALDKESEDEVQKALNKLQKERTSITIAHRLSTIENCDVIFVLEHGEIVEKGSHKELYDKKGKYYSLYKASISV